jgi:hypothetical protein
MKRLWVWCTFECSPELIALLGGVVALQMPHAFVFEQVFEVASGLFRVILCRALYSRDCVVWLTLAVRIRLFVIVATPRSLMLLMFPPVLCLL